MSSPYDLATEELRLAAGRVGARANIRDVRLVSASVEVRDLPTPGRNLTYELQVDPSASYDSGDSFFAVQAQYVLEIGHAPESDANVGEESSSSKSEVLARLEFAYAALFELELRDGDEEPSEEELAAYASTTGHFAIYPYAREYVQDVTGRLAFPPLTLRVLRIDLPNPTAVD